MPEGSRGLQWLTGWLPPSSHFCQSVILTLIARWLEGDFILKIKKIVGLEGDLRRSFIQDNKLNLWNKKISDTSSFPRLVGGDGGGICYHTCPHSVPGGAVVKRQEIQETQVRSLGWEDPLEKEMATHPSSLAWENSWTEEPGGLLATASQTRTQLSTCALLSFCLTNFCSFPNKSNQKWSPHQILQIMKCP